MSDEEKKIGVYLCSGCGIGDSIDMDATAGLATGEMKAATCIQHNAFCSAAGLELLKADMADNAINSAVIAACSQRVMTEKFQFDGINVIRTNLREQVVWCQPPGVEDTQMMADDQVRMGITQAALTNLPTSGAEGEFSEIVLVVGGGFVGMSAAIEASKAGAKSILVERSDKLGGMIANWSKVNPDDAPYREPQDNPVPALIEQVNGDANITVMLNTVVAETSGMPGQFTIKFSQGGTETQDLVGGIVVATGWRPYDATKLGHLGYGASPDVVTNVELEGMFAQGPVTRKSDGKAPKTVAFVQCAGSRDPAHLPYCSSVCCSQSIKHAMQLIEADPDVMCYVIFDELRTPGTAEEFYRSAQEKGVIFVKGKVSGVGADLTVTYHDELIGDDIPMEGLDMVVLATGMVPNSTNVDLPTTEISAEQAIYSKDDINPNSPIEVAGYKEGVQAPAPIERPESEVPQGASILNLQYRQGPHIPMLADGFSDSHYICFPYETRRTGIYTAGPVRRPMDMGEAQLDAGGAVLKVIQAVNNVREGRAVHPRVGDLSYPKFGLDQCTNVVVARWNARSAPSTNKKTVIRS
ncbi:MAG: CoB--CoM heterodisulfide reductase iron-sulfur subunit A family protein [Magnetovibrio sp.]|nr:CoB--CoM heterodisulfide reductase iron-sulfur subunit A family protein [Magnetovibrio sp.]